MDMSVQKRLLSRPLAVLAAVAAGVIGCLLLADVSAAAVPPEGLNCVAADGKINGRGATFQLKLQENLAAQYRDDFCGNTKKEPEDPAGNTMIAYNYPEAAKAEATGSGAGLKAASCRTDAYAGSDKPYNRTQLKELDEAPGKLGGCAITFTPPFQPNSPATWPDKEAGKEDITANMMSFPVAGSSVALPVNLTAANCEGTAPTELKFTAKEVSRIFGGDAKLWSDAELAATNAVLAKCKVAITRVVRKDASGTTSIFKSYLIRGDEERSGAVCAVAKKWSAYFPEPNTEWPGKQKPTEEGECSAIITGESSGGQSLIKKLKETSAGVGYADLADAIGQGFVLANVQNSTATSFQTPNVGSGANCSYSSLSLPGVTANDAVGLNQEDSWANDNETTGNPNHQNATDIGSKYPICGITFDFVFSGLDNGKVANPISRLSADQRRTLYSYFTFALSSVAQENLTSVNYASLPASWLLKLREGFQANF